MVHAIDPKFYEKLPLQGIIDAIAEPVCIKDQQHRWVFMNEAFIQMTGFSADQMLGKSDYDFFPKEQADVFWQKDDEIFESGGILVHQEELDDAEGVKHIISTKKQIIYDHDAKPYLVCIISDITELIEAKESAESNRKTMANFLASMSHDIRTPMNGILGLLELMTHENAVGGNTTELIKSAHESAKSLQYLLDDILDITKIQADQLLISKSSFSLYELIEEIRLFYLSSRTDGDVEFKINIDNAVPENIYTDKSRVKQILINLVSNASKFTQTGYIEIQIKPTDTSSLQFVVLDTGPGIAEDHLKSIFEPFKQGDQAMVDSKVGVGVGLGLAIVSKLSALLEGSISVRNRKPAGCAFTLELPLIVGEQQNGVEKISVAKARKQYTLNALVVDDHPTNIMVAEGLLKKFGLKVRSILSAENLLEICSKEFFDVIFMDVEMPDIDGFTATRMLREHRKGLNRQTPIVAVTGHALTGYKEKCLAADMNDYITKPISFDSLQEVLERVN